MVAFRPDDSDLARDLAQTERVLAQLEQAYARLLREGFVGGHYVESIGRQRDACRRHLELQRANVGAAT